MQCFSICYPPLIVERFEPNERLLVQSSKHMFMKVHIWFLLLALTSSASAQTGIIAAKSHHLPPHLLQREDDHFGEVYIPLRRVVDTVVYLEPGCIIEIGTASSLFEHGLVQFRDTIRDSAIRKDILPEAKEGYVESTVFIGFEPRKTDAAEPYFDGMKRNGFGGTLFLILTAILCIRLFLKSNHQKSEL